MSVGCLHLVSNGVPGCAVPDRKCLPCSAVSIRTTASSYLCYGGHKLFWGSNGLSKSSLNYDLKRMPVACNMSSNSRRRNPDFSRQQKGSSRGRSRQFQERENYENLEEDLSSKNGPLSLSGNQRGQATAKPGQREKEIVELFRKVQARLRARAAIKEEKKMEASQQGPVERGTVDSLLKLLRKHSIDQGGKSGEEFSLDQPAGSNSVETEQPDLVTPTRPVSNFRRKSPVPRVRFQPIFSAEEDGSSTFSATTRVDPVIDEQDLEPEPFDGPEDTFLVDPSDTSDTDETFEEVKELSAAESVDLSSLKLSELRGIAKSRGIKGYSKLKKAELVEMLIRVGAL